MKTIIAGSRDITDMAVVEQAIRESGFEFSITEVVSGGARGVDALGEQWADRRNVKKKRFTADWDRLGKSAGAVRNEQMANYAEALIAVWDGRSRGTRDMILRARDKGLPYHVHRTDQLQFKW